MSDSPIRSRFVALDVHKQYVVVGAIDAQQRVVLSPKRMSFDQFEEWSPTHLHPTDAVVLEATTNAWYLHDQLQLLVGSVTIAHPLLVKLISAARVKTDTRDTLNLARLLAAGLIPAVWVPPEEVRELRALIAHRRRLIAQRTQARNRLQSVLHRHNIAPPEGGLFVAKQQRWWDELPLSPSEKLRVRQDLTVLTNLTPLIEEVEAELCRLSATERWADQVPYLVQRPRIGILIAMVLLSAIGDVTRFPSAKHLVGYAGLGASVHESRANLSHGSDYQAGETGTAYGYGRGSMDSRRTSSPLEGTIRAALSTTGKEQSDCGHCSQTPGRGLACSHQSGGRSTCRSREGGIEVRGLVTQNRGRESSGVEDTRIREA
jgi:transposase